jgi:hypothetical protein
MPKPRNKIRQRRRLADKDMSKVDIENDYLDKHRVGFMVLNAPDGLMKKAKVTTCFTDPKEAEAGATWFLDAVCRMKGIEPPAYWELEMLRIPPITH